MSDEQGADVLSSHPVANGGGMRFAATLDRIERLYLIILRAAILVIATIALIWAAWLGVSAVFRIMQSPSSVVEQPAKVDSSELPGAIAPAAVKAAAKHGEEPSLRAARQFYTGFVQRYHNLYRTRFEPYRRTEDKQLNRDAFDDNFVHSDERLAALARGEGNFAQDRDDLEALFQAMSQAATLPQTVQRLQQYKTAQKRPVRREVERMRTESRSGWDSLSTNCLSWYESPIGCPVTRRTSVPYTETVTEMALPEGLLSHTQIFRAMQDRFGNLLSERRQHEASVAQAKRTDILAGQAAGWNGVQRMLYVVAGFLVLMFFFLLIAIERHQRRGPPIV